MKMMPPDVISHENQLQHLSEPSIFMLDIFRTADHAEQIFIPSQRQLTGAVIILWPSVSFSLRSRSSPRLMQLRSWYSWSAADCCQRAAHHSRPSISAPSGSGIQWPWLHLSYLAR